MEANQALTTTQPPARDLTPAPQTADTSPTRLAENKGWTCELCGKRFRRLAAVHLRRHGYTVPHYLRVFGAVGTGHPDAAAVLLTEPSRSAAEIAARLTADSRFLAEVGDAMLNGPMRDRISHSLGVLLETRASMHTAAVDRLMRVSTELGQPWRITQGGEGGTPTDTRELLGIHQAALTEVRSTEELFTKAMKLAIEEAKGRKEVGLVPEGLERYTGNAEKLPVPTNLTPADREAVRTLFAKFKDAIVQRRKMDPPIDVTASVVQTPTPTPVQTTSTVQNPQPQAACTDGGHENAPTPLFTATPVRGADEPF